MKKITISTKNMHCTSCEILIEEELENMIGVKEVNSDYKKQETTVIFDAAFVSKEDVINAIKRVGDYNVEVVKEEDAK